MPMKIFSLIILLFIKVDPLTLNDITIDNSKAFIVLFKHNSLELLSSRDTLMLDKVADIYNSGNAKYIVLESATCKDELLLNKNISEQRFKRVVTYWKKKHGLKKNIFKLKTISSPGEDGISFMNILIR